MRAARAWFLLALTLLSLAGCWNRREMETLGFVIGAAFDWVEAESEYEVTVQIVQAAALSPNGGGAGPAFTTIQSRGKTVFDAVRHANSITSRKIWWGHMQVLLIGEAAARRGIAEVLNWISRDGETRLLYWVLLTRGHAGSLLQPKATAEKIPALGLRDMIRTAGATSTTPMVRVSDLFQMLQAPAAAVVGVIELDEAGVSAGGTPGPNFRLAGSGVIVGNGLVDFLEPVESRGVLWLRSKVRSALLPVPCPGQPERMVGIEITRAATQITPTLDPQGELRLKAQISVEGNVGDQDCLTVKASLGKIIPLEERLKEHVQQEVESALERCRALPADCFGFGDRLVQEMPRVWDRVQENWHETFRKTPVAISIKTKIRATGAEIRPLIPK